MHVLWLLLAFLLWSLLCWTCVQPLLRRQPALAQWPGFYWLLLLICSMPLWPALQWHSDWMVPPELLLHSVSEVSFLLAAPAHPALQPSIVWTEVLLLALSGGWGLGVSWRLWQLKQQWRLLQQLATTAEPLTRAAVVASLPLSVRVEATLQLSKLQLRQQQAIASAFVFGCWRLHLILPQQFSQLTPDERWLVLQHEFCHIRRKDPQQLLAWRILAALAWFNPVLSRLETAFIRAMELTVDQWVLTAQPAAAYRYGQVLLRSLQYQPQTASPGAGFGQQATEEDFNRQRLWQLFQPIAPWSGRRRCVLVTAALLLAALVHLLCSQLQWQRSGMPSWQWPLQQVAVNSAFGVKSVLRQYRPHLGLDLAGQKGDLVFAAAAGKVLIADHHSLHPNFGKVILLDHGAGYQTLYAHLQQFSVQSGDHIAAGTVIGRVGDSGKVTGAHLHFELLQYGQAQDPMLHLPLLSSAGVASH
jgi:murein DD-endopeptidase MepM/ murein hydrolase activator NlpD